MVAQVLSMEFPGPIPIERVVTLRNSVAAIQILPNEDGEPTRMGLITQLPEGAEIEIGGPGFSERTVSVRCFGASYFVFLDDLDALKYAAAAHA